MVGVGRDLCGSPSPTLLPKQGRLQQAAEELLLTLTTESQQSFAQLEETNPFAEGSVYQLQGKFLSGLIFASLFFFTARNKAGELRPTNPLAAQSRICNPKLRYHLLRQILLTKTHAHTTRI